MCVRGCKGKKKIIVGIEQGNSASRRLASLAGRRLEEGCARRENRRRGSGEEMQDCLPTQ